MILMFFNNFAIYLSDRSSVGNRENIHVADNADIKEFVKKIHANTLICDINIFGYDINVMFYDFCQYFKSIEAAGGVVKNNKSEFLLIKRFGIWDLPKGKVEKGETILEAAKREVCEETGLEQVRILSTLPYTYHIYKQKDKWFLKKTYWYLMETLGNVALVPQANEAITDAVWMKKTDANIAISKSYRSINDNLGYLFGITHSKE